jgi:DNA-directed RNA polymerase specialized sigma24 family protein
LIVESVYLYMLETDHVQASAERKPDLFPKTRWSLVVAATGNDQPSAKRALDELCSLYWFPVYGYFRGREESPTDAEDLPQEFFHMLIQRGSLESLTPEAGKLRAFLLAAAKNYLTSAQRKRYAQKRGGGVRAIPIDTARAEEWLALDPPDPAAGPDVEFDRAWARTLLDRVRNLLDGDYQKAGKSDLATALFPHLEEGADDPPYRDLSRELGMSVGSLRVALFRFRQRYRALLKQEIAETLSDPSELESEIGQIIALFQR